MADKSAFRQIRGGNKKYSGRYCKSFYCDRVNQRRCCADCWRKRAGKCDNFCLNDPSRCKLEDREAFKAEQERRAEIVRERRGGAWKN